MAKTYLICLTPYNLYGRSSIKDVSHLSQLSQLKIPISPVSPVSAENTYLTYLTCLSPNFDLLGLDTHRKTICKYSF